MVAVINLREIDQLSIVQAALGAQEASMARVRPEPLKSFSSGALWIPREPLRLPSAGLRVESARSQADHRAWADGLRLRARV